MPSTTSTPSAYPTPITPPRVPLIDERTGLIDRAWYMFFISLFRNAETTDAMTIGPSTESLIASYDEALRQLGQYTETLPPPIDYTVEINEIKRAGNTQPSNETGELQQQIDTVRQDLQTVPAPAVTELQQQVDTLRQEVQTAWRPELGTFAALQQANLSWVTFDTTPQSVPTDVGTVAWDGGTTLGVQATANVLMQVGEAEYAYVKASAAITKGELCYHTGSVGASGVITAAPTPLALADPNQIVGVAAESIALNGFGLIQVSGTLRGFNTTGASVGEVWADGDPLYYNPAYVGGLTKTKPSAPNQKTYIGEVINASSGGSGSISIRIVPGSVLGGTDSNVQFGTLANNDLIQYSTSLGYWRNIAATSVTVGFANNLTGGLAGSLPYQSAVNTTTFLGIGTALQVLKVNSGATAPEWVSGAALTKVDDTNVTLTLGGTPATSLLAATSLTLGWTGQLAVSRGGTGVATATANTVFAGPTSGGAAAPSFRSLVAGDIPALPYNPAAAPVTQTANFSVGASDVWIINNKSGSSCTVTLPTASSYSGRVLYFLNYQNQTLVSASSNVVPLAGGAAGTAILEAVAGANATLVSDGTNWIMTQYDSNNALQLE